MDPGGLEASLFGGPIVPPNAAAFFAANPQLAHDQPPPPPQDSDEDDDERSNANDDEEDDDDEHDEHDDEMPDVWQAIIEDASEAHPDEIDFAIQKGEHSAADTGYWASKTWEELDDPQLVPGDCGRIDWLVDGFNGTQEKPNMDPVMRSQIVNIGGYDWQVKLYPKGYGSNYLSVYVENVSMKREEWASSEPFEKPPFPFSPGTEKLMKRRSVAVQIGVLMFNPDEPRTNHFQRDAHQYHKAYANYGWPRFSNEPRHLFHFRKHGERKAILRNDKLGFSAYIRIVHDPTGSMWEHSEKSLLNTLATTGLSPLTKGHRNMCARQAAILPLMHFRAFRDIMSRLAFSSPMITEEYQELLIQMFRRTQPVVPEDLSLTPGDKDVVRSTSNLCLKFLHAFYDAEFAETFLKEVGGWDTRAAAVGKNRLSTRQYPSIQKALKVKGALDTPTLLPLELERRTFCRENRKWQKLLGRVEMQDRIMVQSYQTVPQQAFSAASDIPLFVPYHLYAFVTHVGNDLAAEDYAVYVRPRGPGGIWYCYKAGSVEALTHKQAVGARSGCTIEQELAAGRPGSNILGPNATAALPGTEVAYLVYYVREDAAEYQFNSPVEESNIVMPSQRHEAGVGKLEQKGFSYSPGTKYDLDGVAWPSNLFGSAPVFQYDIMNGNGAEKKALIKEAWKSASFSSAVNNFRLNGSELNPHERVKAEERLMHYYQKLKVPWNATAEKEEHMIFQNFFGGDQYSGTMLHGEYHGRGWLIGLDGDEYHGDFIKGVYQGEGTLSYARTRDTHTGHWVNGLRHGMGSYTTRGNNEVWQGTWEEDEMVGEYILRGTVAQRAAGLDEDKMKCRICYVADSDVVLAGCGHTNLCEQCASMLDKCPICATPIAHRATRGFVKVYGAQICWKEGEGV